MCDSRNKKLEKEWLAVITNGEILYFETGHFVGITKAFKNPENCIFVMKNDLTLFNYRVFEITCLYLWTPMSPTKEQFPSSGRCHFQCLQSMDTNRQ